MAWHGRYTFPLNCYSETLVQYPGIVASMATAHGMIGKVEPILVRRRFPFYVHD